MTDLEELEALLCKWDVPYERHEDSAATGIFVGENYGPDSPKVDGYYGFFTQFEFTGDGSFVKMGAWE